jgi:hypothetical protein
VLTLLDLIDQGGGSLRERRPRIHKELVKYVLQANKEGITARGIEKALRNIADIQIEFKYSQSKYELCSRDQMDKEKKRDYQLLTLSTPRIIEILKELEENEKIVKKTVIEKNYHLYQLRKPFEEQSQFWHFQSLMAYHNLMTLPWGDNYEQSLEELVKRIGVYAMYMFLYASRDLGNGKLSKEDLDRVRFDYVESNVNPRLIYHKISRFFIPKDGRSISKADFDYLNSLMEKKYPQYIKKINEGAKQAGDALPVKRKSS